MTKNNSPLIGAHVSSAGGVDIAVERAHALGANCMQVFSGSPRMWKRLSLDQIRTDIFFSKQRELQVAPVFTHALYLVNLASNQPELIRKSAEALKHDLQFDSLVKGAGVIVHLGSHQGRGWEAVKVQLVELIKEILNDTPLDSTLIIENSAGQKGKVASELSEIKWLIDQVKSPRLKWCFDTCHAHTAGFVLGEPSEENRERKYVIKKIDHWRLWETLVCIHVNDSRDDFGSGRDRHANLGEGKIASSDLKYFLNHPKIKLLPLILEVPGFDGKGPDAENVRRLKKLIQ